MPYGISASVRCESRKAQLEQEGLSGAWEKQGIFVVMGSEGDEITPQC